MNSFSMLAHLQHLLMAGSIFHIFVNKECVAHSIYNHYIFPSFPSVRVCVTLPPAAAVGPADMCASKYIAYISVSNQFPLAVTGPHGQLASCRLPMSKSNQTQYLSEVTACVSPIVYQEKIYSNIWICLGEFMVAKAPLFIYKPIKLATYPL